MIAYFIAFGVAGILLKASKMVDLDKDVLGTKVQLFSDMCFWLAVASITLLVGLRGGSVGSDSINYISNLAEVASGQFGPFDWQSPLYYFVTLLVVKAFNGSYTSLFFICGFLVAFFFCKGLRDSSPSPMLGLFVIFAFGYFFEAVNQIRQLIAAGIVFYGYKYLKLEDVKRFVICCAVGAGFHFTAATTLLIPVFYKKKFKASRITFIVCFTAILVITFPMYHGLLERIPFYGENYINTGLEYDATITTVMNCIVRTIVFILLCLGCSRIEKRYPDYPYLLNIILVGVIFQIITVLSVSFGRIPIYFFVFLAYAIPQALRGLSTERLALGSYCLVVLFFVVMLVSNLMLKDYSDYQYRFFWDEPIRLNVLE